MDTKAANSCTLSALSLKALCSHAESRHENTTQGACVPTCKSTSRGLNYTTHTGGLLGEEDRHLKMSSDFYINGLRSSGWLRLQRCKHMTDGKTEQSGAARCSSPSPSQRSLVQHRCVTQHWKGGDMVTFKCTQTESQCSLYTVLPRDYIWNVGAVYEHIASCFSVR